MLYTRKCFLIAVLPSLLMPLFGQTKRTNMLSKTEKNDTEGEALFKENKGEAAIAPLEAEIAAGDESVDKYNFLGLAYYQAGDYKHSIQAFERGIKLAGSEEFAMWALSYNAGNSAFADGNFAAAEGYYTDAYRGNGEFHAALLNRANARLNQDKLLEARDDYSLYLERCPDSPQSERINALLVLLDEEIKKHAILPEKLERTAAILPVAAVLPFQDEVLDNVYEGINSSPLPPVVSEAMEKEAALLQSQTPFVPVVEGMEKDAALLQNEVPIMPSTEGMEKDSVLLQSEVHIVPDPEGMEREAAVLKNTAPDIISSEEMKEDIVAPPPVKKIRSAENIESLEDNDITAPPVKKQRSKMQNESMEKVTP